MKQLWMRAGVYLQLTDKEAEIVLSEDSDKDDIALTITNVIIEGRFGFNGESYVPFSCVDQYNDKYGTAHKSEDIEFELAIDKEELKC